MIYRGVWIVVLGILDVRMNSINTPFLRAKAKQEFCARHVLIASLRSVRHEAHYYSWLKVPLEKRDPPHSILSLGCYQVTDGIKRRQRKLQAVIRKGEVIELR